MLAGMEDIIRDAALFTFPDDRGHLDDLRPSPENDGDQSVNQPLFLFLRFGQEN